MAKLTNIVARVKDSRMSIDKVCQIKNYLPINEKIKLVDEYKQLLGDYLKENTGHELFMAFIFFHLMVVKYYTDIELDVTCDEYDLLQSSLLVDKIVEKIGSDYDLLLKLLEK